MGSQRGLALSLVVLLATASATGAGAASEVGEEVLRTDGPAVVKARTVALLLSGLEGGSLRTALLAATLPVAEDGELPAVVIVEVGGRGLLAALPPESPEGEPLEVEVFLYALRGDDEILGVSAEHLTLDLQHHRELLAGSGLRLLTGLRLPPGEYRLRLLVQAGGVYGLSTAGLVVRASGEGELPPPWLSEPAGGWLSALATAGPADVPGLFTAGGGQLPWLPAARPVLAVGSPFTAWLLVPASEALSATAAAVRFEASDGGDAVTVAAAVVGRWPAGPPGVEVVEVAVEAPGLAPGRYLLTLSLGGERRSAPLPVLVAADPRPWPRLELPEVVPGPRDPARRLPARASAPILPTEVIRTAYAGALRQLAEGRTEQAVESLGELERSALEGGSPLALGERLEELEAVEWGVLEALVAGDPETALPALRLHAELARVHRRGSGILLADHSIGLAARLAEVYAAATSASQARRIAASALGGLAAEMQSSGRGASAHGLLRRALSLDPDHVPSLHGLAALDEREGRYDKARIALERLVALAPDHAEGHLRLAVNLERTGKGKEGRRVLEDLATHESPEWVVALAAQEMARLDLAAGSCARAEETLRRAIERWPQRAQLRVQLAFALDCQGRWREARALTAKLMAGDRDGAGSDRYRYAHWPREELVHGLEEVAREAERRRGNLVLALGPVAAEAGR